MGDILATGYWAAQISEISSDDTVLIIGAGPTGICTLECVGLYSPAAIVVCETDPLRRNFVQTHYPQVKTVMPSECESVLKGLTDGRGADRVIEVAGTDDTFRMAWQLARPNAIVTIVALYDKEQTLPFALVIWQNLTFKTGGVGACDCNRVLCADADSR